MLWITKCNTSGQAAFVIILKLSVVRMIEVVICQNGLLQNLHLSEWTFSEPRG